MPQQDSEEQTFRFHYQGEPEIILQVVPADMQKYRELKRDFDKRIPPPEPPLIRVVTFESALDPDGPGYEEMPDFTDEKYKAANAMHFYMVFLVALGFFEKTCIRASTQKDTMMIARLMKADFEAKKAFVDFVISISEITWDSVLIRMEELDYKWGEQPLHLIATPTTPGRMSVKDALYKTAADIYTMAPLEVDKLTVAQQVDLLARGILWSRLQYLQEEKRAREAEQKAKMNTRRGRR